MNQQSTRGRGKRSIVKAIENIIGELKKVVWPTKQETINLSIMVIIVSIVVGIILGLLDFGFTELMTNVFFRR